MISRCLLLLFLGAASFAQAGGVFWTDRTPAQLKRMNFDGTSLQTWFKAPSIAARRNLIATLIFTLHNYAMRMMDLQKLLYDVREVDQLFAAGALDSRTIQTGRQTADNAYRKERATLDAMMTSCGP